MMQLALAHRPPTVPPRLSRWRGRMEQRPLSAALVLGACLGLLGTLGALLVLVLALQLLPPEQWGHSAASSLAGLSKGGMVFLALVYAPVAETLLGQLLPVEIAQRLGAPPSACVLLSGLIFACAHLVNGGPVHGLTTLYSGMVFACAYLALRWLGIGPAFLAACAAHAVQNGTILFIVALLYPGTA